MRVAAQPGFRMDICDCPLASPAQAQGLNKRAESGEWRKESGGRRAQRACHSLSLPPFLRLTRPTGWLLFSRQGCFWHSVCHVPHCKTDIHWGKYPLSKILKKNIRESLCFLLIIICFMWFLLISNTNYRMTTALYSKLFTIFTCVHYILLG